MENLLAPFAGARARSAADRLIAHFGSIGRALAAPPDQLARALGRDQDISCFIVAARTLILSGLREEIRRSPVSTQDPRFRDYVRALIGKSATECLHATFVTHDWGYLADEVLADGAVTQIEADLRRLLSRAFALGAPGVILAHNHPSGSAEPSADDIKLTNRIADLTQSVGITLLDHLIVGEADIVSLRERGLI